MCIRDSYKIMYQHLPHIIVPYHVSYAVMATAAAVLCLSLIHISGGEQPLVCKSL